MDFKFGTIISMSLWMIIKLPGSISHGCTSLSDLAEPCGCPLTKETLQPVCASDGKSYLNMCFFDCEQVLSNTDLSVVHEGACSKDSKCTCNPTYSPVCGNNGVTYTNECVLKCQKQKEQYLKLKHRGKCPDRSNEDIERRRSLILRAIKKCYCNVMNGPVCGTNGVTYANPCVLQCKADGDKSLKLDYWGECQEDSQKNEKLSNKGFRKLKKEEQKKKLNRKSIMRCGKETNNKPIQLKQKCGDYRRVGRHLRYRSSLRDCPLKSKCTCNPVHHPVCATNGVTYANNCILWCKSKMDPTIQFQRWGECDQKHSKMSQPSECHNKKERLSDKERGKSKKQQQKKNSDLDAAFNNNGIVTYLTRCGKEVSNKGINLQYKCGDKKRFERQLRSSEEDAEKLKDVVISGGPICFCMSTHRPVCSNHGDTYANNCVLHCSAKNDPSLQFKHWGPCSEQEIRLINRFKSSENQRFRNF